MPGRERALLRCGAIAGAAAVLLLFPVWGLQVECVDAYDLLGAGVWGAVVGSGLVWIVGHPTWALAEGMSLLSMVVVGRGRGALWLVVLGGCAIAGVCVSEVHSALERKAKDRADWGHSLLLAYPTDAAYPGVPTVAGAGERP